MTKRSWHKTPQKSKKIQTSGNEKVPRKRPEGENQRLTQGKDTAARKVLTRMKITK